MFVGETPVCGSRGRSVELIDDLFMVIFETKGTSDEPIEIRTSIDWGFSLPDTWDLRWSSWMFRLPLDGFRPGTSFKFHLPTDGTRDPPVENLEVPPGAEEQSLRVSA